MHLLSHRSGSRDEKPLPSAPCPASPTLTNPDMVLPDNLPDNISFSSSPKAVRPPSPSYLIRQGQQKRRQPATRKGANAGAGSGAGETKLPSRHAPSHRPTTPTGGEPVLRTSPARRAQYRYTDAPLASSPTVADIITTEPRRGGFVNERGAFTNDDENVSKRLSIMASSINSDDLDAIRMPEFAGLDNDSETVADTDLDTASHAGERVGALETEQSNVTLMRAELILANAKKRLNLMDQNLRGAREIVAPLTAANLKRATSLHSTYIQPAYFATATYNTADFAQPRPRLQMSRTQPTETYGHNRVFSDSVSSPITTDRPQISSRPAIPISKFSPSWTSNGLRGSRSQEQLEPARRPSPRPLHGTSTDPKMETLLEHDTSRNDTASRQPLTTTELPSVHTLSRRPSTTTELREQMYDLKERISTLKERARDDSLRRRSIQTLRQPCPLVNNRLQTTSQSTIKRASSSANIGRLPPILPGNPSPPLTEDGQLVFDPHLGYAALSPVFSNDDNRETPAERTPALKTEQDHHVEDRLTTSSSRSSGSSNSTATSRTITDVSETTGGSDIYEDAPDVPHNTQRHEDREDAFDYKTFFLHSSMGTFSRPRGSSISSTDSGETARGPATFDHVPPTPETPETLREIERNLHVRAMSTESTVSIATFKTAREGIKSGRQTPMAMAEWLAPKPKDERSTVCTARRTDSGINVIEQFATKPDAPQSRPSTSGSQTRNGSISRSPTSLAVSTLLDPEGAPLGLKDRELVFTMVDSLKHVCEQLQAQADNEAMSDLLRKRLYDAQKILEGGI